ncbi:hypothetical protein ACCS81_39365, partial [Rhizobium ruizarguesonis]
FGSCQARAAGNGFAVLHCVAALRVQAALAARLSDRRSRSRWPRPRNGGFNMSRQQSNQRSDIYSRITNTIIADL